MNQLTQILIKRLENKGMESKVIPGFMRALARTLLANPDSSYFHLTKQLRSLGWDDLELDYRTIEIATACFEADGLKDLEMNPSD